MKKFAIFVRKEDYGTQMVTMTEQEWKVISEAAERGWISSDITFSKDFTTPDTSKAEVSPNKDKRRYKV